MPFGGKKLSEAQIARIAEWIRAGAPFDEPLKTGTAVPKRMATDHWAFRPPRRSAVPTVKEAKWVRNPIDAFLIAEQEKRGLKPLPEADRYTLLRRVYLDLAGIPPTREQLHAFLADRSDNAYEKVVDQLLASPQYGERWGRHWMDIWRYSDWYGSGANEVRNSQRHIWRWRDWIIQSLNDDKGYDRMILEMLAGDEIAPGDTKVLPATGFLARNWFRFNRNVWLQDTIESVTASFLGVTLKCARCHDHKYDPFAQEEYYKFRAFFEPHDVRIDRVSGEADWKKAGLARIYDSLAKEALPPDPDEGTANLLPPIFGETYLFLRGDEKNPDKDHPLSPAVPQGSLRWKSSPSSFLSSPIIPTCGTSSPTTWWRRRSSGLPAPSQDSKRPSCSERVLRKRCLSRRARTRPASPSISGGRSSRFSSSDASTVTRDAVARAAFPSPAKKRFWRAVPRTDPPPSPARAPKALWFNTCEERSSRACRLTARRCRQHRSS
jgi:hypothetical protein